MSQLEEPQTAVAIANRFWPQLSELLTPPQTNVAFDRLVEFSHQLIDAGAGDETSSLASLLDLVGILIIAYEREHDLLWEQQFPAS